MLHKILVVDDMRSIYNAIQKVLSDRDCVVDYADSGSFGLQMVAQKSYDLILLDIHMPDHNGLWVCRQIKKMHEYKHIPVLLLTSDMQNLDEGLLAGASDYILKPFNNIEMIARVSTQIKLSKARLSLDHEKKRLKNEIKEKRKELNEAQNDLERYFYQTSHKLRSPIYSIKGLLNLIKMEYPVIMENEYITRIQDSIKKIENVNEQVSTIGHLRSMVPSKKYFTLGEIINSLFDEGIFQKEQFSINIDHEIKLKTDKEVFLYGLLPVIKNAIHYSSRNNEMLDRVKIETIASEKNTYLIIHDHGPGIGSRELDHIFEMFYIGDDQSAGNGLGLFISKLAFDQIGLSIKIQSKKQYFTRVIIDITSALAKREIHHEERLSV